jgi:hypothetical protein
MGNPPTNDTFGKVYSETFPAYGRYITGAFTSSREPMLPVPTLPVLLPRTSPSNAEVFRQTLDARFDDYLHAINIINLSQSDMQSERDSVTQYQLQKAHIDLANIKAGVPLMGIQYLDRKVVTVRTQHHVHIHLQSYLDALRITNLSVDPDDANAVKTLWAAYETRDAFKNGLTPEGETYLGHILGQMGVVHKPARKDSGVDATLAVDVQDLGKLVETHIDMPSDELQDWLNIFD